MIKSLMIVMLVAPLALAADIGEADRVTAAIAEYEIGKDRAPIAALEQLVRESSAQPDVRARLEQKLVKQLDQASDELKLIICQQLWIIGSERSVTDVFEKLLADDKTAHAACYALKSNPSPRAGEVLRKSLATAKGRALVTIIGVVGDRRDEAAVEIISKRLRDGEIDDVDGLAALGKIGSPQAVAAIQSVMEGKGFTDALSMAYAQAAERVAKTNPQRAAEMFSAMTMVLGEGSKLRSRMSYIGQIEVGGPPAIEVAKRQITFGGESANVAIAVVARSQGSELVAAAIALLPKLEPDTQAIMIEAFAPRREASIKDAITWALAHENLTVRTAGLKAAGKHADADFIPDLIKALANPDHAKIAAGSLAQIHGEKANAAIVDAIPNAPAAVRIVLLQSLPMRQAVAAIPQILNQAKGDDPAVAVAALDALAILARSSDITPIVAIIGNTKEESVRKSTEAALIAISTRSSENDSAAILAALADAKTAEARCALIRVLVGIADEKALDAVKDALRDGEPAVRDCALRTLAAWPNAAATPALLAAARMTDANNLRRAITIRGALRQIAAEAANQPTPTDQLVDWFVRAESMVRGPEEKRLLVSGLANLRHAEAMKMIARYVEDDEVRAEAGQAAVEIAKHRASGDRPGAKELLERVIATTSDGSVKKKAQDALAEMK